MRIIFLGSQEIGAACLRAALEQGHELIGVGLDHPAPHERWEHDVVDVVSERGTTVFGYGKKLDIDAIRKANPDLILVVGWRWLFPPELLKIPKWGCIAIHASLLPKHRGFAPINYALIDGDEETGVTAFRIDDGTDTGDIAGQRTIKIYENDDAGTLRARVIPEAAALTRTVLARASDGILPLIAQDHAQATTGARRNPASGEIPKNL